MRTDETLRLRLAECLEDLKDGEADDSFWEMYECVETRANVEYARAQVERERRAEDARRCWRFVSGQLWPSAEHGQHTADHRGLAIEILP